MLLKLTNRQRADLATLCIHKDLQLGDVAELRAYNRLKSSLKLSPIITAIIANKGTLSGSTWSDPTVRTFSLPQDASDFFLVKLAPLIAVGDLMLINRIGDLVSLIDVGGDAPGADAVVADIVEEWNPPQGARTVTFKELADFLGVPAETPGLAAVMLEKVEQIVRQGLPDAN